RGPGPVRPRRHPAGRLAALPRLRLFHRGVDRRAGRPDGPVAPDPGADPGRRLHVPADGLRPVPRHPRGQPGPVEGDGVTDLWSPARDETARAWLALAGFMVAIMVVLTPAALYDGRTVGDVAVWSKP